MRTSSNSASRNAHLRVLKHMRLYPLATSSIRRTTSEMPKGNEGLELWLCKAFFRRREQRSKCQPWKVKQASQPMGHERDENPCVKKAIKLEI